MKKLLAICLSVLLLCAAMPFAFATAADEAVIAVSDVEGKAGETVAVTISLKNNPGIQSAKIGVGYDASVLELVLDPEDDTMPSVEYGTFHPGGYSFGPVTNNPFVVNWCYTIGKNYTDENLITLQFKIKDGAAAGTYPLTLTYDCDEDFYNKAWDTIYFSADEGSVTVVEDAPVVPTIVLPNLEAKAGDEIAVKISLKNNPGIQSAKIGVGYDASALELVLDPEDDTMPSVEYGTFHMGGYSFGPVANNPFVVNWCYTIGKNYADEDLITLKFKVKDDAVSGTYPLTLTFDCDEDFYNKAWETIYFTGVEGSVIVEGVEPEEPECTEHVYDAACDPVCNVCGETRPVHTEGIIHFDAVDAGCHYIGNIEYWFCPECECFWADEALTQLTNSKNVILPALGGDVAHIEAVAPACHYNGNIEYWVCYECEQFWQDEALTQLTNSKNVILPAIGSENVEHVEAVAPTCSSEGNIEYWHCADCDQYWQDEALTQLTNRLNVKLGVTDHNIIHFDAVEPGCHYVGNIEYWFCTACEAYWQNAALTELTNSHNIIIPALGGDVAHIEAVAPGCHYNGNIEYWVCYECEQFWQDEALTQLTNSKNVILPAIGSENVEHVEAVAPTCSSEGNIEYWHCADCDQYWQDEALTQLTNRLNVKLGVTDHNLVHIDAVAPGCHYIGNIEYWYCTTCEMFWQDEALTQLTNSKNVILPAIGSENVEHVEAKDPTCLDAGNIEYWFCSDCEQYWQDEALTQITNSKNVLIAPVDHTIVHIEAVAPGCHYIGNIEYWYCSVCEMFWQDAELTQITNSKNVLLPAAGSENLQHVEAKEPVGHENGNIEYWFCPDCEQYWQDEALTQLTNVKNVIIANTNVEYVMAKDPTEYEAGNKAHWYCHDCGKFFLDADLTQETTEEEITIPATGVVGPEDPENPDSPDTGDSTVAVVVALLTLIASGVAVSVLKNKKRA